MAYSGQTKFHVAVHSFAKKFANFFLFVSNGITSTKAATLLEIRTSVILYDCERYRFCFVLARWNYFSDCMPIQYSNICKCHGTAYQKRQKCTWFHLPIFNHLNIIALWLAKVGVIISQQFNAYVIAYLLSLLCASDCPCIACLRACVRSCGWHHIETLSSANVVIKTTYNFSVCVRAFTL